MAPDDGKKTWGTIYLGARHESTVDQLDAMQAAARQEQWNQRTQDEYLERVRAKATERAKEILGAAYAERQNILDEAREEARRICEEARSTQTAAENERATAAQLREAAQQEREAAQEEGFNAGLDQAQGELAQFRTDMGASVAGVLGAIRAQCGTIFEGWRQEMTQLLKVCVEKSTGLVLEERHAQVLEHLVMAAVRQLDDRRCITLRVNAEDEAAVADMVAAARERVPNVGQWIVVGDASLEPGGLVAESQSGTVDSRLELHRELVENILQHLALPSSALDTDAARTVEAAMRQEVERIAAMSPPGESIAMPPSPAAAENMPEPEALPQTEGQAHPMPASPAPPADELPTSAASAAEAELPVAPPVASEMPPPDASPDATPDASPEAPPEAPPDAKDIDALTSPVASAAPLAPAPDATAQTYSDPAQLFSPGDTPTGAPASAHEPTRQELEEELLPLPQEYDAPANPPHVDAVLAQGGFLDGGSGEPRQ